jgi:hypothetical protein
MQDQQRVDDILAQADIILPSQYFSSVGSVGLSGEQRLMLAVLADAINVLQSWKGNGSARKRHNFAEAAQWVNLRGTHHPFSFDSVCDALEIDSELLRSRLRALTIRPANSAHRPALGRLRLKELSRSQQMTANRLHRRRYIRRTITEITERTSALTQECTEESSSGLPTFGEIATGGTTVQSVSW